jgi:hypothetical protein
MAKGKI